jgi:GTP-binding protein YchF
MRLGIIGLPQSGKTTIFNALTHGDQPLTSNGGGFEVHTGVVDVPDRRIDVLAHLFNPDRTVYAKVTYADIAGLDGKANPGVSGPLLNQLTQMDGFLHVVRCFESPIVAHPLGSLDAVRDIQALNSELLLNDLIMVEHKIERLEEEGRRNGGKDKSQIEREKALFQRLQGALSEEIPLRDLDLSPEEEKMLSGYGFLSRKPLLIVLNLGEGQDPPEVSYDHKRSAVVDLQGKLEMDIAQLPPDEAEVFLDEYGILEPGLQRVIRLSYDLLGLIPFFTVGEDEVRAWTVHRGSTALQAAGAIHSDLQKGFIRAEVIAWDDLVDLGSLPEGRAKGKLRLEGKDYLVKDGEIVHVRFNV